MNELQSDAKARLLAATRALASPTRSRARATLWLTLVGGVIVATAIYFQFNGVEHGAGRPSWFYVTCTLSWAAVAVLSSWGALGSERAASWRPRSILLLVAAGTPGTLFATMFAAAVLHPEVTRIHPERLGLKCLGLTLAGAAFPLLSMLYVRRGSDPVHPALAGAALGSAFGASSGIMVQMWCPVAAPAHVAFGHILPIVLLGALGSALGAGVLRVRRVPVREGPSRG